MQRDPVKSSNIKSIGYDSKTRELEVEFTSGGVYKYADVSKESYNGLMHADSIGSWFHAHIRNSHVVSRQDIKKEEGI